MNLSYSLYGFILSFAIFSCLLIAEKRAQEDGKNPKIIWDIAITAVLCGLVGARAYHVTDYWSYYSQNPIKIFEVWEGGLAIWGALVGGLIGLVVYFETKKVADKTYWLDLIASVMPLGQAIGRWGNYFNQENYGLPTNLPWKIFISPEHRLQNYENVVYYHPLFLYESVLDLLLFVALTIVHLRTPYGRGKIFSFYLLGYSAIRFFLEFLRIRNWAIDNINVAQSLSLIIFITVTIFLLKHSRSVS